MNVERVDIISEFKHYIAKMRESAVKDCTNEDKINGYDIGVDNAFKVLEMILHNGENGIQDRIIYFKQGEHSSVRQFIPLSDVVKEIDGE